MTLNNKARKCLMISKASQTVNQRLVRDSVMLFNSFQQYFSYIVAISFIGGGNQRKQATCKCLTYFII